MHTHVKLARLFLLLLLIIIIILSGCMTVQKQDSYEIHQSLQNMIDTRYATFSESYDVPPHLGILLHLHTPTGDYTVQSGFLGKEYSADTHYRIASVTKTFTAAAIMLLDQQGLLDIYDTVTSSIPGSKDPYLPDTDDFAIPYKDRITIKDLLSHRAGVFDVFNDPIPIESDEPYAGMNYIGYIQDTENDEPHRYSLSELAAVIAKDHLTYGEPGTLYHYSDSGYMLLPVIIERVSGIPYDQFLSEHFFVPMGLHDTTAVFEPNDTLLPEPYFEGYSRWDAEYFNTTEDNMSSNIGAGNIISTPKDMASWMRLLLSGQSPLKSSQITLMTEIPEGNNAYALGLSKTSVGIGHSGAHPGYLNFVVYDETSDVSMVVVMPFIDYNEGNMDHVSAASQMMIEIMETAVRIYSEM